MLDACLYAGTKGYAIVKLVLNRHHLLCHDVADTAVVIGEIIREVGLGEWNVVVPLSLLT